MTAEQETATPSTVLDFERLERKVERMRDEYQSATPFPHIVIDDLLEPEAAKAAIAEFPSLDPERGTTTSTSTSANSATPIRDTGDRLCNARSRISTRPGSYSSSARCSVRTTSSPTRRSKGEDCTGRKGVVS